MSFHDEEKKGEELFGKHTDRIINGLSLGVMSIMVAYFTLRVFEIIPSAII